MMRTQYSQRAKYLNYPIYIVIDQKALGFWWPQKTENYTSSPASIHRRPSAKGANSTGQWNGRQLHPRSTI